MADGSGLKSRHAPSSGQPRPLVARGRSAIAGFPSAFRYCAFLSYPHADEATARWLHESLEKYRVPKSLVGRVTANGVIPARLNPIFRDRHELAASGDLAATIREALATSRFLIVLCSPAAAASRWTNAEIDGFKKLRPDGCVLAAIVSGEPFASEMPGREAEECFPLALRHKYDRRGRPTKQRAEPIAADLRETGDGRRLGLLKIIAGMLGVGLDDLVNRESHRRHKRLRLIAAASLAGMGVTSTLSILAFQARNEAREQRRDAEGLVGFMLGDLRKKLEPIGRLDALDAVGARALGYYEKQDKASLSDESLAQRSRALTMMGEIAFNRGDLDGALERYREALASTAEQLRRRPRDPQRLFDQAQNVFWVGWIALQRGRYDEAADCFRQYKRLADRMIALAPEDPKYRQEGIYADSNLGIVLIKQWRFAEAVKAFQRSLAADEALAAGDPRNGEYRKSLLEDLAWLSEASEKSGLLDEAIAERERALAMIGAMPDGVSDTELRSKALIARRALGRLFASRGQLGAAIDQLEKAVQAADGLVAVEPGNSEWLRTNAWVHLELGELLRLDQKMDLSASAVRSGCDSTSRLLAKDRAIVEWGEGLRRTCAMARAQLALASNNRDEALSLAREAASASSIKNEQVAESRIWLAGAQNLLGDMQSARGEAAAATEEWKAALAQLPPAELDWPAALARRAILLRRLGERTAASEVAGRLERLGYRHPYFTKAFNQGEKAWPAW